MDLPSGSNPQTHENPQARLEEEPARTTFGVATLARFLIGDREAILTIASSPRAIGVAVLFVFCGAFARRYDQADFLVEPWWLITPLLVSLAIASVIWLVVLLVFAVKRQPQATSGRLGFRAFLTLYWMTAPMALLYAIPYERFLSEYNAVAANLWTLGIVSVWRVTLVSRGISVLSGVRWIAALAVVMLVADPTFVGGLIATQGHLIDVMGGIQRPPAEALKGESILLVIFAGFYSSPVWLIGTGAAVIWAKPKWVLARHGNPVSRSLWVVAILSVVGWSLVLPFTQREQVLQREVELHFHNERFSEALRLMSAYEPGDFPPHWNPPRWKAGHTALGWQVMITRVTLDEPVAPWVADMIHSALCENIERASRLSEEDIRLLATVLPRMHDGPRLAAAAISKEYLDGGKRNYTEPPTEAHRVLIELAKSAP